MNPTPLPPAYYPIEALTQPPFALSRFGYDDTESDLDGIIEFMVWFDREGTLERTELIYTTLNPTEAESVLAEFRRMRFSPGELQGRPVPSTGRIVLDLKSVEFNR